MGNLETIFGLLWALLGLYGAIGLLLLVPIQWRVLRDVDDSTVGASWGFRLIISPGLVVFWPLVIVRWFRLRGSAVVIESRFAPLSPQGIRTAQRVMIYVVVLIVIVVGVFALRDRPRYTVGASPQVYEELTLDDEAWGVLGNPFESMPITLFMAEGEDRLLLLVDVAEDLGVPAAVLYWSSALEMPVDPKGGTWLGAVWGPSKFEFELSGKPVSQGWLTLYSLARQETIASARVDLSPPEGR